MNQYTMVVAIVFICVAAGIVSRWLKQKGGDARTAQDGELERRMARIDALEERVRTLESIVTDRSFSLREQFRDLERK